MIDILFDKLYRYDRISEPCYIGIPVKKGELKDAGQVKVLQEGRELPLQTKVTSRHEDGSVRFLFLRFLADLPANKGLTLQCDLHGESAVQTVTEFEAVQVCEEEKGISVRTGCDGTGHTFSFCVQHDTDSIFTALHGLGRDYDKSQFEGPFLKDGEGNTYRVCIGKWQVVEHGPICAILKAKGSNVLSEEADGFSTGRHIDFEVKLTAWAGKPWVEIAYRIINTTDDPLHVAALEFSVLRTSGSKMPEGLVSMEQYLPKNEKLDSTGCGDLVDAADFGEGPIFHARGTNEAEQLMAQNLVGDGVRTCVASSNYKTDYHVGRDGVTVNRVVDSQKLMKEANEHYAEVLYGTFFADCTDADGGVTAVVYQAQQNYPKAVQADENGVTVMLVPEGVEKVVMQSGMSREQKMLLLFHTAEETITEINNRSLIYQMPDRPYLSPGTHAQSGVWMDVFAQKIDPEVERSLVGRADGHCRAYGMLNFGDSYDSGYTAQGRGGGRLVWCNNEYDYPHACALLYVRTGVRRFLDYNIASCSHWMDVDVCHYHKDPMYVGGQWEHTGGHCVNGVMVCSHEWVEGLLDYYHFTGDERGLETALGIGDNVMRLLDMPMYAQVGEANARETGWALRTLTALYIETRDVKWIGKCQKILNDFFTWEKQYGNWLAPYTDNTTIRVGFMISIAVGSLMRYYREFPDEELKGLMLRAVDDLVENCYVKEWDLFYYKELPSLNRRGNNTLLLEALAIAYELSGNKDYLKYGIGTFRNAIREATPGGVGQKKVVEDAVVVGNASSKQFAQSMIPLSVFYRAIENCGLW